MPILVALRDRIGECDSGEVGSARFPNHETWREEYASRGEGGFRIRSIMARKAVTAISR